MNIGYWINDGRWKLVNEETYEKFDGKKCISSKNRSPTWFFIMESLVQLR